MIARIALACVVFVILGLVFVYLVGPILIAMGIPFLAPVGAFFTRWGWVIALALAVWFFFSGQTWPRRT